MTKKRNMSIRPINKGTVYDIPGNMKRLSREIEKGEYGAVSDVLTVVKGTDKDGSPRYTVFGNGRGEAGEQYLMACFAATKIMGMRE